MLILTCGINGSYVFTPGVVSFQETPKVPVADTVGAGDSFTAAFCASILNGKSVPKRTNWLLKFPLTFVRRAGRCLNFLQS